MTNKLAPCARCKGPKDIRGQGKRYCSECQEIAVSDATAQAIERKSAKYLAEREALAASGVRVSRRIKDAPAGTKWCAECQRFRRWSSFAVRDPNSKPAAYCIPCQRVYNMRRRLERKFGITIEEYDLLLACQDGRCAICKGLPRKNVLAVDHDHDTGEIRGLLCSRCNHKLLGSANDNPERLRAAADYLEAFAPREVFGERKMASGSRGHVENDVAVVRQYVQQNGFPAADVTSDLRITVPGVSWTTQTAYAESVTDSQVASWLDEANAAADGHGILILKRRHEKDPGAWAAVMAGHAFVHLAAAGDVWEYQHLPPVQFTLADAVLLLRHSGYGNRPDKAA